MEVADNDDENIKYLLQQQFEPCEDPKNKTKKCTLNKTHRHCKLCNKHFTKPYNCKRHYLQSHKKRLQRFQDQKIFPCKCKHPGITDNSHSHYHCPFCDCHASRTQRLFHHLKKHKSTNDNNLDGNRNEDYIGAGSMDNNTGNEEDMEIGNDTHEEPVEKNDHCTDKNDKHPDKDSLNNSTPRSKRQLNKTVNCEECGKQMKANNLQRHLRTIHNMETQVDSVCVDDKNGVYMVRKSEKGGVWYPLHVKKCLYGATDVAVFCEDSRCKTMMNVANRSGIRGLECRHLQMVGKNTEYPPEEDLDPNVLEELGAIGKFKLLQPDRIQ